MSQVVSEEASDELSPELSASSTLTELETVTLVHPTVAMSSVENTSRNCLM
tara:strand:- start:110 stop:262 length:153 start_codon:yes stop_codon:yes gene_type:complete